MAGHPFIESDKRKVALVLIGLLAATIQTVIFVIYGNQDVLISACDSTLSVLLLIGMVFFFWFITDAVHVFQVEFVMSVAAIIIWVAACLLIQLLINTDSTTFFPSFIHLLPLRLITGISLWVIFVQWYKTIKLQRWKKERLLSEAVKAAPMEEIIDRIAVKEGAKIHIIPINELTHIQACGDYITLHTPAGEFLKEQTMKSLEAHLPSGQFVRIHRSFIVNVEQINRVELFGKETYHVLLKNGKTIRASISGYKLLKGILSL